MAEPVTLHKEDRAAISQELARQGLQPRADASLAELWQPAESSGCPCPCTAGVLGSDDVLVSLDVGEVEQPNRDERTSYCWSTAFPWR